MRVEHQRFGFGKIVTLEGPANNKIATINFDAPIGQKKIMLNYAKLSIIE
jgi:DNA helicase-2/ATP-dependent DNA helicase PcrA